MLPRFRFPKSLNTAYGYFNKRYWSNTLPTNAQVVYSDKVFSPSKSQVFDAKWAGETNWIDDGVLIILASTLRPFKDFSLVILAHEMTHVAVKSGAHDAKFLAEFNKRVVKSGLFGDLFGHA